MSRLTHQVESDVDLFSKALLLEGPYEAWSQLRELGGAPFMRRHGFYLLARYDDVRAALQDWPTFTSARGTGLDPRINETQIGGLLASDPPAHDALRQVLSEQVSPRAIRRLSGEINAQAAALVDEALPLGSFDAITQLAQKLPLQVVADLIGLPEEGRENLIPGADAAFATFGPITPEIQERMPFLVAFLEWVQKVGTRETLTPGSWGAAVLDAVDEGRLPEDKAFPLMRAFLVAGMDTTVNGIGSMLRVFAERPDVWEQVRDDVSLAGPAFEETLRFESPVQAFFRETTRDVEVDGTLIPEGSRVCLHFASANRDERHFGATADEFDLHRGSLDHLAFGNGVHGCAGQGLARLEARAIVTALAERVESLTLTAAPERYFNPVIRGLRSLPVKTTPRSAPVGGQS